MKRILCILTALLLLVGSAGAQELPSDAGRHSRVFYEIFVGSFSDSNGDGIGDLRGIINRMDYLRSPDGESEDSLGVEGLWLTPVFTSPSYHKYDVTDYYAIDPVFGTMEDLRELISICHARDVLLIMDLPLNHTGSSCSWFSQFAEAHRNHDQESPYYDFYSWIPSGDPVPAGRRFMPLDGTDILYECNFSDDMPELNFDNPSVLEEAVHIAAYYLDMGVDGFRFDAAKYVWLGDTERNIAFWKSYLEELRSINPEVYTVAEVWDSDAVVNEYIRAVNCFRFSTSQAEGAIASAAKGNNVNKLIRNTAAYLNTIHAFNPDSMPIPFISNHDMDRAAGFLPVSGGKAAMAASLYLLSPGSPFIYYGEEIGLKGSRGASPTDANRRCAMRWGDGDTVQDPDGFDYENQTEATVAGMLEQDDSLLRHYQKVLSVRRSYPEIAEGSYEPLVFDDSKAGGFLCSLDSSVILVLHNTTTKQVTLDLKNVTEHSFSEISVVLEAVPGKGGASLEDGTVILGPQTSVIIR